MGGRGLLLSDAEVKRLGVTLNRNAKPLSLRCRGKEVEDEMLAEGFLRLLLLRQERSFAAAAAEKPGGLQRCVEFSDPSSGDSCGSDSARRPTDPVQAGTVCLLWRRRAGV